MALNSFIRLDEYKLNMPEKTEIQTYSLIGLLSEMRKGNIRIPDFQRGYIWTEDQVLELLESVWNGYPLGSILLWKTNEKLKERDPLDLNLPDPVEGSDRLYLLDGQQRLISLYSVIHGKLHFGRRDKIKHEAFFNLDTKEFAIVPEDELKDKPLELEKGYLPLTKLFHFPDDKYTSASQDPHILTRLAATPARIIAYTTLYNCFTSMAFPAITNGQTLSVACNIFERLNNTGARLTVADLMVAITYKKDFNLRDRLSNFNDELDTNYFAVDERTILQCISACLKEGTERSHIIDSASEIHTNWGKTTESIGLAIDFLKNHCSVPTSNFLPYEIVLAPLTYFFYLHGGKQLDQTRIQKLQKYFWENMFSERYTSSQPTRAGEDIRNMVKLFSDSNANLFNYLDFEIPKEAIMETEMAFNSSFAVTILCFMASRTPKEFKNNTAVKLDQTFGESNQKQLHHIFPVHYLKTKIKERHYSNEIKPYINSIANISLISKGTNRAIWDSPPSEYFAKFEKENPNLETALKSHLISDIDEFGIRTNDFSRFIQKRSEAIATEISTFMDSFGKS
ncbi:MAG TPA: DUF262 domain-containing protein [Candidatus Bathyarchaeia archaeon]|nr:DUF262 domain-containing protein [Candidatus Bathyarchaeia archaeon]